MLLWENNLLQLNLFWVWSSFFPVTACFIVFYSPHNQPYCNLSSANPVHTSSSKFPWHLTHITVQTVSCGPACTVKNVENLEVVCLQYKICIELENINALIGELIWPLQTWPWSILYNIFSREFKQEHKLIRCSFDYLPLPPLALSSDDANRGWCTALSA